MNLCGSFLPFPQSLLICTGNYQPTSPAAWRIFPGFQSPQTAQADVPVCSLIALSAGASSDPYINDTEQTRLVLSPT